MARHLGLRRSTCIAALFAALPSIAASQQIASDAEIRDMLTKRVATGKNPGIVVGIYENGRTRIVAAGSSGAPSGTIDGNTVFEIGSITKVFTGTVLADMVARKLVAYDDSVSKHLPSTVRMPSRNGRAITLVELSTQHSGLPRLPDNLTPADRLNPYADYTIEQMYDFLARHELRRDPGEMFEYSNLGVGLLGHVLARRAETSYEALVVDRILGPLGMSDTRITLTPPMRARLAQGHNAAGSPAKNWDLPTLAGAGALRSTANDMLRFAAAALGASGTPPAIASAFRDAERPRRDLPGPAKSQIGLNWFTAHAGPVEIVWHNGGTGGYRSYLGLDKARQRAVIVFTNSTNGVDDIGRHLLDSTLPLTVSSGATSTENAKLDPAVRAAIDSGRTSKVIVLGRTQLFEPVGGLDAFAARNANRDRLTVRKEVVAALKKSAHDEQRSILAALGKPEALRSLWIVNAIVLSLSPDEVRRVAALDAVRFVYRSTDSIRNPESPSRVSVVPRSKPRTAFDATGKRVGWNVERIGAARVWRELGITGEGVTVAVLDAGVNYEHTDLRGNIWVNTKEIPANGVDDDRNGYVDDVYGYDFARMRAEVRDTSPNLQHGTMTSGIVGGDGSGGIVTGVAPRVRLMPMLGSGVTSAALAYQYALENGADIVSMSFSIPNLGNVRGVWRMMSEHAVAAGLVLVGGAGNFRTSSPIPVQHQSPKDVPAVISVAGVDSAMQLVPFSSGGPAEWGTVALYGDYPMPTGLVKPDVVAFPGPGYPVLAAADSGYIDPNTRVRGNSFSGPHGAGVAALVLSAVPSLPAWRVKEILEQTARELGPPGKDNDFGAGLIDAFAAVKHAQALKR